jgi:hypothetical protein
MGNVLPSLDQALAKALLRGKPAPSDGARGTITAGVPFDTYLALDTIHTSTLKEMAVSPRHYRQAVIGERRTDTKPLRLGRVLHAMTLTPKAPANVTIFEGRRAGKVWEEFEAAHKGSYIVTRSELSTAAAMRESIYACPEARELLADGEGELTMKWIRHGMAIRGRLDWLGSRGLVELKSTRVIEPRRFAAEVVNRAYHAQIGMYADGVYACTGELPAVSMIVVENVPPHDVVVYRVRPEDVAAGWQLASNWIERVAECTETGRWPGVAGGAVLDLELPSWTFGDAAGVELNLEGEVF